MIKKIIYLIAIIFIFYVFGLVLSNIINNIFPACDFKRKDGIIIFECVVQLIVLYTIYILSNKKLGTIIEGFYKKLTKKKLPGFYTSVILIAFSMGIFKHLENLNERTDYLKKRLFK
jgi:hypothetical protein